MPEDDINNLKEENKRLRRVLNEIVDVADTIDDLVRILGEATSEIRKYLKETEEKEDGV